MQVLRGSILLWALLGFAAHAADISISSESLSVSDDDVTTYMGDVTVVVPAGMEFKIDATQRRMDAATEILEGTVRIVVGTLEIRCSKATVMRKSNGETEIKMDLANSREIRD